MLQHNGVVKARWCSAGDTCSQIKQPHGACVCVCANAVLCPAAGAVTVWNTKATFPYAPSSDLVVMVSPTQHSQQHDKQQRPDSISPISSSLTSSKALCAVNQWQVWLWRSLVEHNHNSPAVPKQPSLSWFTLSPTAAATTAAAAAACQAFDAAGRQPGAFIAQAVVDVAVMLQEGSLSASAALVNRKGTQPCLDVHAWRL